jgi:hypothetical protein
VRFLAEDFQSAPLRRASLQGSRNAELIQLQLLGLKKTTQV